MATDEARQALAVEACEFGAVLISFNSFTPNEVITITGMDGWDPKSTYWCENPLAYPEDAVGCRQSRGPSPKMASIDPNVDRWWALGVTSTGSTCNITLCPSCVAKRAVDFGLAQQAIREFEEEARAAEEPDEARRHELQLRRSSKRERFTESRQRRREELITDLASQSGESRSVVAASVDEHRLNQGWKGPPAPLPRLIETRDLSCYNLSQLDLSDSKAWKVNLTHARCTGASFRGASLQRALLQGCFMSECNLRDAKLALAVMDDAIAFQADLTNADLTNASLKSATLAGAKLVGASFLGTNLSDCKLIGAAFSPFPVPARRVPRAERAWRSRAVAAAAGRAVYAQIASADDGSDDDEEGEEDGGGMEEEGGGFTGEACAAMLSSLAGQTAQLLAALDGAWIALLEERFADPAAASAGGKLRFAAVAAELLATRGIPHAVQALLTRRFVQPLATDWIPSLLSSVRSKLGVVGALPPPPPKRSVRTACGDGRGTSRVHIGDGLEAPGLTVPAGGALKAELAPPLALPLAPPLTADLTMEVAASAPLTTEGTALLMPLLGTLSQRLTLELEACVAAEVPGAAAPVAASLRTSLEATDADTADADATATAALTELRVRLRRVLDSRFQRLVKGALYGTVRNAIAKHSGRGGDEHAATANVARLGRQLEHLEETLVTKLTSLSSESGRTQLVQRYAGGGSLRGRLMAAALAVATTYEVRACGCARVDARVWVHECGCTRAPLLDPRA